MSTVTGVNQSQQQTRPDPNAQVTEYMNKHNCTRQEAIEALREQNGGKDPVKPPNQSSNNDVSIFSV